MESRQSPFSDADSWFDLSDNIADIYSQWDSPLLVRFAAIRAELELWDFDQQLGSELFCMGWAARRNDPHLFHVVAMDLLDWCTLEYSWQRRCERHAEIQRIERITERRRDRDLRGDVIELDAEL
ncbi:MAG: hypothetical protein JO345_21850 [Streptosporangiaceae bacterium]|nr:hypothetical protein [Streptosporangiaceae bacterium]